MSFAALMDIETCPRRWALSAAEYPHLWKRRGYPHVPQLASIEGTVVHLALKTVTSAIVERGCPSLTDESALLTLRELGGYTAIIRRSLERALQPYQENPRAAPVLDIVRTQLSGRIPELRSRVQKFLSRIHIEPRTGKPGGASAYPKVGSRQQLPLGSHSEVELRVSELRWLGVADLITLMKRCCEIRDFKTGTLKEEHEFQVRTYALLWARDADLNPSGRLADKLVLSGVQGDLEVPAPNPHELRSLEDEIRQ